MRGYLPTYEVPEQTHLLSVVTDESTGSVHELVYPVNYCNVTLDLMVLKQVSPTLLEV